MERCHISNEVRETPLATFLWGGKERLSQRRQIIKVLTSNPAFSRVPPNGSLSRKESWTRALNQSRELIRISFAQGWSPHQFREAVRMIDGLLPVQPQFRIFMSNLERQMSDEQKAIWMPKAERFEIFGSYAQTELGHGSNVRGIETTATFDSETDEFIINSPTLSSTKYWIGSTGIFATHSLVVARLIINGRDHGNHLFLTQIRSLATQELMPGVEIYDLGPKVYQGMVGVDNGAMQFHNVRIPRCQMLARNARVERDGTYVAPCNDKHAMGSMVTVRAIMAEITGFDLLKAVAVAYHYTTFRRQFRARGARGGAAPPLDETVVYDYASVRFRLLPLLAQGTAIAVVGQHIKRAYDAYTEGMLRTGDTSQLEDLHLQTVGSKVYSTHIAAHGIEACRLMCGGHGYSALSGFGGMYANAVNAMTYEGDNYVIAQQVPRAILKHWKARSWASVPSIAYLDLLERPDVQRGLAVTCTGDWMEVQSQQWVLERRLAHLVRQHVRASERGRDTSFTVHELTMAHCDYTYFKGLWEVVRTLEAPLRRALEPLAQVFGLHALQHAHKDLPANCALTDEQRDLLQEAYGDAVEVFATHAKTIIEGYGFTEWEMDSALARADDTPYEALWKGAKASELNHMQHLWPQIIAMRRIWKEVDVAKARL